MTTPKWIKLTGFKYQQWKGGNPTNKIQQREVYVNPAFIASISEEKLEAKVNSLVQIDAQIGSKVLVAAAGVGVAYEDVRPPEELIEAISKL